MDAAVASGRLHAAGPCRTKALPLTGAAGYTPALHTDVAQHYRVPHRPGAIDTAVARYLAGVCFEVSCRRGLLRALQVISEYSILKNL